MTFFETIRGVECEITAELFTDSCGLGYSPEVVFATSLNDGTDIPLSNGEIERLIVRATMIYYEDD